MKGLEGDFIKFWVAFEHYHVSQSTELSFLTHLACSSAFFLSSASLCFLLKFQTELYNIILMIIATDSYVNSPTCPDMVHLKFL